MEITRRPVRASRLAVVPQAAENVPQTQYLKLNVPPTGMTQWGPDLNYNFYTLDSAVGALQHSYQGEWVSTKIYALGQIVTYNALVYISLSDGNINQQPDQHSDMWGPMGASTSIPYPPTGLAVSNGTSWSPSIDPAQLVYLNANNTFVGIQTIQGVLNIVGVDSTGSFWIGQAPTSGGKGMAIKTTSSANLIEMQGMTQAGAYDQTISLNPQGGTVLINNALALNTAPTVDTVIDKGWKIWRVFGTAPAAGPGNGADASSNTAYTAIGSAAGQGTTGTTGQKGGAGAATTLIGGTGGTAPAGSTNGDGGAVYVTGGQPGQGAGTVGKWGSLFLNSNGGDTYIGGNAANNNFHVRGQLSGAPGVCDFSSNTNGAVRSNPAGGLTISWNAHIGYGETDFINSTGGAGHGFYWYNVAPNTLVDVNTVPAMYLDASNNLRVAGNGFFGAAVRMGAPNSPAIQIAASGTTSYFDAYGDASTNGDFVFRSIRQDASNLTTPFSVTPLGTMTIGYQGHLRLGERGVGGWGGNISPNINSDSVSLVLNANSNGSVWFNYDQGTGGVHFMKGDNTGSEAASITAAGLLSCGQVNTSFLAIPSNTNNLELSQDGGSTFIDGGAGGRLLLNMKRTGGIVQINGALTTSGSKQFRITHPDDDTKLLSHACLEGPEHGVYYRGEAVTDGRGMATITLPEYFEGLTRKENRSVLLTHQDDDLESNVFVMLRAGPVVDGVFGVRSSEPNIRFLWVVLADRGDIPPLDVVTEKTQYEKELEHRLRLEAAEAKENESNGERNP